MIDGKVTKDIYEETTSLLESYETLTEFEALSIATKMKAIETTRLCFGVNGECNENSPAFLENISMSIDSINTTLLELLYKGDEIPENTEREIFGK